MNIQFMTKENNGVYVKDNWTGRPTLNFIPDFDEMIKNASCEEEADKIREIKERHENNKDGLFSGFAFPIVYMTYKKEWDCFKGWTGKKTWQMMQHPWYHGCTKEEMLQEILEMETLYE